MVTNSSWAIGWCIGHILIYGPLGFQGLTFRPYRVSGFNF